MPRVEAKELQHEAEIVWLDDIEKYDYVRESIICCYFKQHKIKISSKRCILIGYAVLDSKCPPIYPRVGFFNRRVFILKDGDRCLSKNVAECYKKRCPFEAVDPRTVFPKVSGTQTERSLYGVTL